MVHDWLGEAARWRAAGERFVLVTIMGVRGSAPVRPGTRMLVAATRQSGTVGGGRLEAELTGMARMWLAGDAEPATLVKLGLGARLGQCCGGRVVAHLEMMAPLAAPLVVFGAGHVAQELVPILARLGRPVVCADSRPAWLARLPRLPVVEARQEDDLVASVPGLPAASVTMVMTHRHDLDYELCRELLRRDDLAFVGCIGSATKGQRFRERLAGAGLDAARLECPLGENLGSAPAVVAVAMAARVCAALADSQGPGESRQAERILDGLAMPAEVAHSVG